MQDLSNSNAPEFNVSEVVPWENPLPDFKNSQENSEIESSAAAALAVLANGAVLSLKNDGENSLSSEAASVLEDRTQLSKRAGQGDTAALKQILDFNLASCQAKVIDIELRQGHLQISLSSAEVPIEGTITPLIQRWMVQLSPAHVSTVELYGQRDGCELPYWRVSFNLEDLEALSLNGLDPDTPLQSEVILSTPFIDPLQADLAAPSLHGPESPLLNLPIEVQPIAPAVALKSAPSSVDLPQENPPLSGSEGEAEVLESTAVPALASTALDSVEKVKAVKDFLARYAAGEREFTNINLSETDLSGVNLTLANLHHAELIWSNLKGANLYHINLSRAKLRHANLSGVTLRSSNLQGADFLNANLKGADLSWSNLNGANLTGADLTDANFNNAILERVILPDGTLLD